jgi:histidyl-tRNA synthetase
MKTAPAITDFLNDDSRAYFEKLQKYLTLLDISFVVDPNLVRGLDYYNHTAFEIMSEPEGFGAITTLCGGGRYNGLAEDIGGPETPGIGFALSIERFIAALDAEGIELNLNEGIDCYLVSLGEEAKDYTVGLLQQLRQAGFSAERDYLDRKIKGQFKAADRVKAKFVAVLGDDELKNEVINLKDMTSGEQKEIKLDSFITVFQELQDRGGL